MLFVGWRSIYGTIGRIVSFINHFINVLEYRRILAFNIFIRGIFKLGLNGLFLVGRIETLAIFIFVL